MASEETQNFQTFVFQVLFIVLFVVVGSWTIEILRVAAKAQAKRDEEADGFPFTVPEFRFFSWRASEVGYSQTKTEKRESSLKHYTLRDLSELRGVDAGSFTQEKTTFSEESGGGNAVSSVLKEKGGEEKQQEGEEEEVGAYTDDDAVHVHVGFGAEVSSREVEILRVAAKAQAKRDKRLQNKAKRGSERDSQEVNDGKKLKQETEMIDKEVRNLNLSMPLLVWGFFVRETFAGILRIAFLIGAAGATFPEVVAIDLFSETGKCVLQLWMYLGFSLFVLSLWKCYYLLETPALQRIWCEVFGKDARKVLASSGDDDEAKDKLINVSRTVDDDDDQTIDIGKPDLNERNSSGCGSGNTAATEAVLRASSRSAGTRNRLGKASYGSVRTWSPSLAQNIQESEGLTAAIRGSIRVPHFPVNTRLSSVRSRRSSKAFADEDGRSSTAMTEPWYEKPFMSIYSSKNGTTAHLSWAQFLAATALLLMLCVFLFAPLAGLGLITFQLARGCGAGEGPPFLLTLAVAIDAACSPIYVLERFAESWYWKTAYTRPLHAVRKVYGTEYPFPFFALFDGSPRRIRTNDVPKDTENKMQAESIGAFAPSHSRTSSAGLMGARRMSSISLSLGSVPASP